MSLLSLNTERFFRVMIVFLLIIGNFGCDQFSKNMVRQSLIYNENIHLIENHLILTKIENTGAFLSFGEQLPTVSKQIFLMFLPGLALIFAFFYLLMKKKIPGMLLFGLCFVIGGGIGNLYDRIVHGSVTDFLHISVGVFRTGIFNMADVSIMLGMGIIFLHALLEWKKGSLHPVS